MDVRTLTDDELRDLIEDLDRFPFALEPWPDLDRLAHLASQELGTREQLAALLNGGH